MTPCFTKILTAGLISVTLSGCHVVKKARQCKRLADTLESRRTELEPRLPETPSTQALESKAQLYNKLAQELMPLPFDDEHTKAQRDALTRQLKRLSTHLTAAARAMEEGRGDLKDSKGQGSRDYSRAKNSIDGISRDMRSTLSRLQELCH